MIKKIIIILSLFGIAGILIWGGVNRTLAKTEEQGGRADESIGEVVHGRNAKGVEDLNSDQEDCEDSLGEGQGREGGNRGNNNEDNFQEHNSQWKGSVEPKGIDDSGEGVEDGGNRYLESTERQRGSRGPENAYNNKGGQRGGKGGGQGTASNPLNDAEIEALHLALDDEYHAYAVYTQVIADFGEVEPFIEILKSENNHINALLKQFEKHDLTTPENTWLGNVPGFNSPDEACQAGVEAELANVALYDKLFSMIDDPGLIQVFTNLSRASMESHLPEFQACQ